MASNFSFGLVALSEVNEILVLLAQTIVLFSLYPIILGYWGHILSGKHWVFFVISTLSTQTLIQSQIDIGFHCFYLENTWNFVSQEKW